MKTRATQRMMTPEKIAQVTDAVRAFCVIYHTSQMYRTDHAVFLSAVEERMPVIESAVAGLKALSLTFSENQIRCAGLPLEPGSSVFQRVAQTFEGLGIRNLTFLPGLTAGEMTRLIALIGKQADAIRREGLSAVLQRERFRYVRSTETTLKNGESAGAGRVSAISSPAVKSATAVAGRKAAEPGGGVWDISEMQDEESVKTESPDTAEVVPHRSMRHFVSGVLGAMTRREADTKEIVEIIATEFEHRLEERVAMIRRESEKKIRRLETIKDLILAELERMAIAAVIMDTELHVLAMNSLAEKLIGNIQQAEPGSPLEKFARSRLEKQTIETGGEKRTAHLVTVSPSGSGSDIMLITLEKQ